MCFGFRTGWIDGVQCVLFSNHAPEGQITLCVNVYLYLCSERSDIRVTVCVTVFILRVECGMVMKGRKKVKPDSCI